ncbi:MAG: FAD-binding oxidoreductase [Xanthomonadaceae bacterium]|nr:FAD-binding oxidoreductase [Xanthomonadaceae bacterium]MDE2053297.1 FAD-binding oxidoreductase [Xanthomonadaceae bacterium]
MMPDTWYAASARPFESLPPLEGRQEARVAIVGGGYAGVCLALGLTERGVRDVVLLESEGIGHGASGRNGGFVFAGYSLGEDALLRQLGAERARGLYGATTRAVDLIRRRIRQYAIECDAVDAGVIWANWFRDKSILQARQQLLKETYGVEWEWLEESQLRGVIHSGRYHDALFERNALHLHPLDYLHGLVRAAQGQGVHFNEHSRVRKIERGGAGWRIRTDAGEVQAQTVVLACGGYLAHLQPQVDRAVLPIATYVMVTESLGERLRECLHTEAAIYDTRFAFDYYRPLKDERLLWGGRISIRNRSPQAVKKLLLRDLLRVFPQLEGVKIEFAWSGLMSYARHQMPQLGTRGDGLWWMQAFGGHGTAPTCAAGELLADALAQGGEGWRKFAEFGLQSTHRPFGYLGAQAQYWWLEAKDRWKAMLEG